LRTAVFSIISPNYRHFARVLMESLRTHHPEWDRFVLMVGDDGGAIAEELFKSVSLDALPLPNRRQFCFRYTILELNTAAKPWMFEHLFARGYERVVYLDPDIRVYSPLAEVEESEAFLVLTPHLTGPIRGDVHPSERTILQAGTYNLGFLAVSRRPPLDQFLAWWQEKLEYQCVSDVANGLFVDQKWIDLTPGFFDGVSILRHDGYNVAYWNLGQRTVRGDGSGATVNGQPLRFFHFSGFDPSDPRMASKHDFALRVTDMGDARKLIAGYDAAIRAAGYASFRNARYAFGFFADGTPVSDAARIAYRNSPALQAAAGEDPFRHPELFREHRRRRRFRRGARLSRFAAKAYTSLSQLRPVVLLFPRPMRKGAREFLLGRRETVPPPPRPRGRLPPGLNIVGNVSHDTGVGESARLCRNACEAAGIAHAMIDAASDDVQHAMYRTSIFHVNADQLPEVHDRLRHVFDASAYNIGCWHWELPELPDALARSAAPLDELWAPTAFIQNAVKSKLSIPVVHMPHGIEVTEIEACSVEELGVPAGRFTFLCMFDFASIIQRKNPLGAVDAFRRAFANDEAALLIKTSRADRHRREFAELRSQLRGIPNVYLSDRMLPRARVNGLLAACDAVVSLHRSEGFGLILAEAMYLGKPVVATGWSGNMDFMNGENSCPVAYELVTLDRAYGPYAAGQQWAEPDVDDAARLMRRVFDDAEFRQEIGARAGDTIRSQFSPAAAGVRYRERLAVLEQRVR
jgi:glycosyltransferase involved in cell wall biosynthesis